MMKKLILFIALASVTQARSFGGGDVNIEDRVLCPYATCEIDGVYFPHPYDCTKFCLCDESQPVEFSCPDDEAGDSSEEAGDSSEETGDSLEETGDSSEENTDHFICAGVDDCPAENLALPMNLPHPTDPTKFCHCDWGVPIEMNCPEGLLWNQNATPNPRCDWPCN
ncbi:unnamed protein product [Cyprideis torosa]|uniref:Uncharacterized protein n=1 Tax=Cyprideis torosa TaxID=163714 RepID=A0A7R8WU39_9CRUS|nr:unnamed protein product [Cyprideis torosa]CAG0906262.1 unnamed protein product [Cyprideis torosa]